MIISKPNKISNTTITNEDLNQSGKDITEENEETLLIGNSKKTVTSSKKSFYDTFLVSWRDLKQSTTEFLNSNNEMFQNVTTTDMNFKINNLTMKGEKVQSMFESFNKPHKCSLKYNAISKEIKSLNAVNNQKGDIYFKSTSFFDPVNANKSFSDKNFEYLLRNGTRIIYLYNIYEFFFLFKI